MSERRRVAILGSTGSIGQSALSVVDTFWGGLADWIRATLIPRFIDREDIDIFRVVETPEEAVRLVKQGLRRPWWRPLDDELAKVAQREPRGAETPLAGGQSTHTGEGTRYGSRPHRTAKKHAAAKHKPEQ